MLPRQLLEKKYIRLLSMYLTIAFTGGCPYLQTDTGGPDYMITNFEFSATPQNIGSPGNVSFKIKNKGADNGQSLVNVSLYICPYQYFDENHAIFLNSLSNEKLAAGQSSEPLGLSYTIPAGSVKTSYLLLKIDTTDTETDTFNNVSSSSLIIISNGDVLRNLLNVNTQPVIYTIGDFETLYFYFQTQANHAYNILWDDYSEGVTYYLSNTAANVKASATTSDLLTTFFSQADNGYNTPQTVFSASGSDIFLETATSGMGGQYSIQIIDIGTPPDLSITITSAPYNNGSNTLQVNYQITNNSTVASTTGASFTVGFWINQTSTPSSATPVDFSTVLNNLIIGPGGSFSGSVSITGVTITAGTAYTYADILNNIAESNKSNNLSPAFTW